MITERELDARLAAAAGFDGPLPALPEDFLLQLRDGAAGEPHEHSTGAQREPASVVAARQIVSDAREARRSVRRRRRRPGRAALLRAGAAVLSLAAACTAVLTVSAGEPQQPGASVSGPTAGTVTPTSGIELVASEETTFPLSLDPAPPGLTRTLTRSGGPTPAGDRPVVFTADYRSADGAGFTVWTSDADPRGDWQYEFQQPQDDHDADDVTETGTVVVGGSEAALVRGHYDRPVCRFATATPTQREEPATVCVSSFADLILQRPDGRWVWVRGEDTYAVTSAVVTVAASITERPVPVDLQIRLAPVGWSVTSYADDAHITVASDEDPSLQVSVALQEAWRGYNPENMLDLVVGLGPVTRETVGGRPARLGMVEDSAASDAQWWLAGQFADGTLYFLTASPALSRDDVLAIAQQVTYAP